MIWDDLKNFKLPDPEELRANAVSGAFLSERMADITNHMVDVGQLEPELQENVDKLKLEIEFYQKERDLQWEYDFANEFMKIPEEYKRNIALQQSYVKIKFKDKYGEYDDNLREMKTKLIKAQRQYNEIERRLKTSSKVLDVARSILSAMKEEIRNL